MSTATVALLLLLLLIELWFYALLYTKQVILETFPKPISWLGMEKLNLAQQKHTFTNQKRCKTTQNRQKNTSYDIRP